ncbi:MAG: hypothetical protein WAU57_22755, partial [Xanthobacteraceae bacterium]
ASWFSDAARRSLCLCFVRLVSQLCEELGLAIENLVLVAGYVLAHGMVVNALAVIVFPNRRITLDHRRIEYKRSSQVLVRVSVHDNLPQRIRVLAHLCD